MKTTATTAPTTERLLYSRLEAARLLSISPRALDYLIAGKQLESRRIGSRVLVPLEALKAFARRDHPFGIVPADQDQS